MYAIPFLPMNATAGRRMDGEDGADAAGMAGERGMYIAVCLRALAPHLRKLPPVNIHTHAEREGERYIAAADIPSVIAI